MLVAAGDGTRLGRGAKALVPIAGRPILDHALERVVAAGPDRIVVTAPPSERDVVVRLCAARDDTASRIRVVTGGPTRQASVALALAELDPRTEIVLVHDAARPFTPVGQFIAVRDAVRHHQAGVVPALALADTIKRVDGDAVLATVDRDGLRAVQTPQGFPFAPLVAAQHPGVSDHTDDAAVFQAAGGRVVTVPGHPDAFKITTPHDLERAERALAPSTLRIGQGTDVHAFGADVPLHLGGLTWPGEPGLAGHSDGDVVCHAVADALLSAGGLGDLGSVFGTDRPEEAGRPGLDFVVRAVDLLRAAGGVPQSVTVQVIGNRPKIAPRRLEIERALEQAIGAPVSVSGTTTDGLGFTGRGEGIAATATALVALPASGARPATSPAGTSGVPTA